MLLCKDGRVNLQYVDWMGRLRHRRLFARGTDGRFGPLP
jgi:hypothetical protein